MKKLALLFLPWFFAFFGYKALAQDEQEIKEKKELKEKKETKETQEIVIRKDGNKDININVQITGDKVLINGKPIAEFKDDAITINRRNMIVRDGDNNIVFGDDFGDVRNGGGFSWGDDDEKRAFLGVTTEKTSEGAKINEVTKSSGAEKAGLKKDDIITKINDKKIDGPETLSEVVTSLKPKDEVKISFKRDGKEKTAKATLQERKESGFKSYSFNDGDGSYKTYSVPRINVRPKIRTWSGDENVAPQLNGQLQQLEELGDLGNYNFNYSFPRRQKLGLKIQDTDEGNGVKVLEVADSSAAASAGIKKDDVITQIGDEKITNTDEAREQLQENSEKSTYIIKVRRNGNEMKFDIKIPKKLKTTNL